MITIEVNIPKRYDMDLEIGVRLTIECDLQSGKYVINHTPYYHQDNSYKTIFLITSSCCKVTTHDVQLLMLLSVEGADLDHTSTSTTGTSNEGEGIAKKKKS